MNEIDVVIIGAGPAGLTAGIYAGRSKLNVKIFDIGVGGGMMATAHAIENYPGFESISGMELAERMLNQCKKYAEIKEIETVGRIEIERNNLKKIKTENNEYTAKAVIIATGLTHKKLNIKGEKEFLGRGVSYCATCDGMFFKGKNVLVVGKGHTAVSDALYLSDLASVVYIANNRDAFTGEQIDIDTLNSKKNIKIFYNADLKEIKGEKLVKKALINVNEKNNMERESDLSVDGVFIAAGEIANTEIFKVIGLNLNEKGNIIVDSLQVTNIDGIFAAGDVTNSPVKQISVAVGSGAIAGLEAYKYVKKFEKIK
ncbi:MAG: FAD-dependent oxidoreductase [Candidatus Altarchaeum sp.]|nr:FAD-dependent oxidoreductase [Candidatus Altarchaeum sp.]